MLACEQCEQCRLARAVLADEVPARVRSDLPAHVREHAPRAVRDGDTVKLYQGLAVRAFCVNLRGCGRGGEGHLGGAVLLAYLYVSVSLENGEMGRKIRDGILRSESEQDVW